MDNMPLDNMLPSTTSFSNSELKAQTKVHICGYFEQVFIFYKLLVLKAKEN